MSQLPKLSLILLIVVALSTLASFVFDLKSLYQPSSEKAPTTASSFQVKSPPTPTTSSTPPSAPSQSPEEKALQIATAWLAGDISYDHKPDLLPDASSGYPLTIPYDRYEYYLLQDGYDYDPVEDDYIMRIAPLPEHIKARVQPKDIQSIDLYYYENTPDEMQIRIHIDPDINKVICWWWHHGKIQ